ncbi:hypothetical protein MKQ70_14835 [Chitinophaga sedimenti]|uniref:hypothetical protein n=1 Tax=Chitinophaga sedimenti TaxID=2033606 RepID=UPI002005D827|nr:hypothetical protein [Chitinophaga sedimenti]MCK7556220.1 hypothetical protein [Chitinophaga sedimenti]
MFDNTVLNIVISLLLIFLMYSLFATALQEAISVILQRRSDMLFHSIKVMLSNTPDRRFPYLLLILDNLGLHRFTGWLAGSWTKIFKKQKSAAIMAKRMDGRNTKRDNHLAATICLYDELYDHPIIKNFGQNDLFQKPSYISDAIFSTVIIDLLKNLEKGNQDMAATMPLVKAAFDKNKAKIDTEVAQIFNLHFNEAAGDLDVFRHRLQKWYNESQDRVTGWYKRNTQNWLFAIGLALAVSFNIDTVEITYFLSQNPTVAAQLADIGEAVAKDSSKNGIKVLTQGEVDTLKMEIKEVNTLLGLGWGNYGENDSAFAAHMKDTKFGWLARNIPYFGKKNVKRQQLLAIGDAGLLPPALFKDHQFYMIRNYIWYKTTWTKLAGFLITAIAIGLGAPFWFDLLNKFVQIRTAGKTPAATTPTNTNSLIDG